MLYNKHISTLYFDNFVRTLHTRMLGATALVLRPSQTHTHWRHQEFLLGGYSPGGLPYPRS